MPAPNGIEPQFLSSDDFHPEFGYLWPTPHKRRRFRKAVMWASAGVVIGAFALLTLAQHGGGGRGEFVSAAAAFAAPIVAEAPAVPPAPQIAITDASGAVRALAPCQDLLGSFIDPQCKSGRLRKSRSERRAANRVVSVPIGRSAFLNRPTISLGAQAAVASPGRKRLPPSPRPTWRPRRPTRRPRSRGPRAPASISRPLRTAIPAAPMRPRPGTDATRMVAGRTLRAFGQRPMAAAIGAAPGDVWLTAVAAMVRPPRGTRLWCRLPAIARPAHAIGSTSCRKSMFTPSRDARRSRSAR